MTTRRTFLRCALWTPPVLLLATACSGSRSGVTVQLDPGPTVPLGGTMTFTLTATSVWDAPDPTTKARTSTKAEVRVLLTDGLELLNSGWSGQVSRPGTTSYSRQVTFKANEPQTFEISVKLNSAGIHNIGGYAMIANEPNGSVDSGGSAFYMKVGSTETQVQRDPFPEQLTPPQPTLS